MDKTRLPQKQKIFLDAFESTDFNVSEACRLAKIARSTYYEWSNKSDEFRQKRDDLREAQCDFVESKLMEQIESGNTTAIIFFCKTKMKHRGYVERQETEISGSISNKVDLSKVSQETLDDLERASKPVESR